MILEHGAKFFKGQVSLAAKSMRMGGSSDSPTAHALHVGLFAFFHGGFVPLADGRGSVSR